MRENLIRQAAELLDIYRERHLLIVTAESCTGGLVTAYLTQVAGASDVVERGFITYSNASKHELLGVDQEMLDQFGAVSPEVALSMAAGALWRSKADISVAVTGLAGPGGGSAEKPVGLVHFAAAKRVSVSTEQLDFRAIHHMETFGDIGRAEVQVASVAVALTLLQQAVEL
jgi:nicotinamide-nucleotide amidase